VILGRFSVYRNLAPILAPRGNSQHEREISLAFYLDRYVFAPWIVSTLLELDGVIFVEADVSCAVRVQMHPDAFIGNAVKIPR
jgi:hypothetical protein